VLTNLTRRTIAFLLLLLLLLLIAIKRALCFASYACRGYALRLHRRKGTKTCVRQLVLVVVQLQSINGALLFVLCSNRATLHRAAVVSETLIE
jgi:hypothetical protein